MVRGELTHTHTHTLTYLLGRWRTLRLLVTKGWILVVYIYIYMVWFK